MQHCRIVRVNSTRGTYTCLSYASSYEVLGWAGGIIMLGGDGMRMVRYRAGGVCMRETIICSFRPQGSAANRKQRRPIEAI